MTEAADADESSVPALWEAAEYLLRWLVALCGDACAVVARGRLSPKERREIAFWLRPVEALVRRLLVVEAARLAETLPPPRARTARPRKCRTVLQDPENSASWAVRFRALERIGSPGAAPAACTAPLACARSRRAGVKRDSFAARDPWPLAERIEAVARVLENPAPFARRLARRLTAGAARYARSCRPPPERGPGRRPRLGDSSLRFASDHALRALAAFDTG